MTEDTIRIERLNKRYGVDGGRSTLTVLENIDLAIGKGSFVSLVGPSGCGKTTLLKILAGLVRYDEGSIHIRDRSVVGVPPNIGFVFQEPGLLPWRTVYGNVELALEAKSMSRAQRRETIDRYLEMMGLTRFAQYPPYQLSGGMQQRVGLARALAVEPDVLFMDEPFGALDALTRARLQEELARIVTVTSTTTVFVTHDVDEAVFLSDRIVVLSARPGRIQKVVEVGLPRPRQRADHRSSAEAGRLRAEILELIESQAWEASPARPA